MLGTGILDFSVTKIEDNRCSYESYLLEDTSVSGISCTVLQGSHWNVL